MNPIIAFDESGNTGSNILDKDQPVFIFASVHYSQPEAEEIVSLIPTNSVGERKFKQMKDRPTHWPKIEALLNSPLISGDHIRMSVIHKPFSIIVHIVDRLIEEVMYKTGFDLYEQGGNLAMANMLQMTLPVLCDVGTCDEFKFAFVIMWRTRTLDAINHFYLTADKLIASCKSEQLKDLLDTIPYSRQFLDEIFESWTKYDFDPALTGLFCLCDYWGRKFGGSFDVYADPSKPLQYFDEYIQLFKSEELAQQELGYDRRKMILPLKIDELIYKDSKESAQVQVADVIAGAAGHYFTSLVNPASSNGLSEIIGRSKLVEYIYSPIWPTNGVTPEQLGTEGKGGISLTDGMAAIIARKRKK